MKKYIILIASISLLIPTLFLNTNNVYADSRQTYSYKGSAYTGAHTNNLGQSLNYNSSFVVITASANKNTSAYNTMGRIFSRCEVVKSKYNASVCYAEDAELKFSAATSSGKDESIKNLITLVTPKPTKSYDLAAFEYFVRYPDLVKAVEVIANESKFSISQEFALYHQNASVLFQNVSTAKMDVPVTYKYNEIEQNYNKVAKGYSATFTTQTVAGYFNLKGNLTYDIRVPAEQPLAPPLALYLQTGDAKVNFSIGLQ